jgi:heme A synthase
MHRFAKFCWFVLAWTVLVILWGAVVRATGSGAGCGSHWPLCNGEVIPQIDQNATIIEFIHRLLSGGAILLVFIMFIWGRRITPDNHPVRKGLAASAILIVAEALLGAGLVLFELVASNQSAARAAVMAIHLLNTFLLLAAITLTTWWANGGSPVSLKNQGKNPLLLILALTGIALIGMTGAITALGDTLFPAESLAHGLEQDTQAGAHFLIRLRIYHPLAAVLIGVYVLVVAKFLREHRKDVLTRKLGAGLIILILIQWAAGFVNILLLAPVPMQVIHLLIADLIWIVLVFFSASILSKLPAETTAAIIPEAT